jgi:penicillin-binding protein 1A
VGIVKVTDGDSFNQGSLVPDETGASGENKIVSKQVIDPAVAEETRSILSTVVTSGTGRRAQTGNPTWGKTGTTDDNGDAWFCGATEKITMCVWVGYPDSVQPMETEFAGAPVDGGTFPALIFAQIVNAYDTILDARKAGKEFEDDGSTSTVTPESSGVTPTTSEEVVPAPETEAEAVEPEPETDPVEPTPQEPAPPDTGGNGAPSAPAGGVAPG